LSIDVCGVLTRPAVAEVKFMHINHSCHILYHICIIYGKNALYLE
jgi:hypothetical protein